jgi:Arc/MetJ-type ribon-helix-helix transcriptional regulator
MTIELTPEHQRMIERFMHSGTYPDAEHVISAALQALAEDEDGGDAVAGQERAEAIEHLVTFGQTNGLSLGGMTIRELRDEARP